MPKIVFRILVLAVVLGFAAILTTSLGARIQPTGLISSPFLGAGDLTTASATSIPLWARSYGLFLGGPGFSLDECDWAKAIQPMGEGRFVVAGEADARISEDTMYMDAAVVELDLQGDVRWKTLFPFSTLGPQCGVNAIAPSRDGGCLAVGHTGGNIDEPGDLVLVMNMNADGTVRWVRSYWTGPSGAESPEVTATSDGGYVVAALAFPHIEYGSVIYGIWVFKIDSLGTVVWSEIFTSGWEFEDIGAIRATSDGGLVVAGTHSESGDDGTYSARAWIMRLDSGGGLEWHKCYATIPGVNECTTAQGMTLTKDGGFALTGCVQLSGSNSKTWVCKLTSSGDIKWQKSYDGTYGSAIIQTSDGGYLVTGAYSARAFKLTSSGAVQWAKKYERTLHTMEMLGAFENEGGGYVMLAQSPGIQLNPAFSYMPWIAMSVDKNGDMTPGCPFVRSIAGDMRIATVRLSSDSFSQTFSVTITHALAFNPQGKPYVRVGANACR